MTEETKQEGAVVKSLHFVLIPVTGVGLYQGFRGQDWYEYRLKIFKEFTLKSLQQQTAKAFILWLTLRPEEEFNPATQELREYLQKIDMPYVMTFEGLMYFDDKFAAEGIANGFKNVARMARRAILSRDIKGFFKGMRELLINKNKTLRARLGRALSYLKASFSDVDYVYVTRIDSDDIFHKDAIKEVQACKPFAGALSFRIGYVYNKDTKELGYWRPGTNPPFYTIIFDKDTFFDVDKYLEYYSGASFMHVPFHSHEDVIETWRTYGLSEGKYCVLVHNYGHQISTVWNHPFRQGEIVANKEKILKEFGIEA